MGFIVFGLLMTAFVFALWLRAKSPGVKAVMGIILIFEAGLTSYQIHTYAGGCPRAAVGAANLG